MYGKRAEQFAAPTNCQRGGANHLGNIDAPKHRLLIDAALLDDAICVELPDKDLLAGGELAKRERTLAATPRRHPACARRVRPRRQLELYLQQPIRIGQEDLTRLIEFSERFGV